MRSGKMMEAMRELLKHLLNELKSPHLAQRADKYYRVSYFFFDENEADNFRKLLLFNIGFNRSRVETYKSSDLDLERRPYYVIHVSWHVSEQEDLIKNIEEYLQEDNMGPTNINRENTKFYAIVTDENGKKTAYEITHSSFESSLEWGCSGSYIHNTLRFDQEDMKEHDCVFTEYVKQKDELEKLKARLGNCENQLRNACGFLSGITITAAGLDKVNNAKLTPTIDIYDKIKDVKFANPATIVFWKDGTKTVVKTQGDEEYIPEVGLAMCICKKVMGNTRDYYRVFKHWMKKV